MPYPRALAGIVPRKPFPDRSKAQCVHLESDPVHTFRNLPTELWQKILDYLCREDLACLALTCRRMHHVLGSEYWNLDKNSQGENRRFLSRYCQNKPSWQLCPRCVQLHPTFGASALPKARVWKGRTRNPKMQCMKYTPFRDFDFARLSTIMDHYRTTSSTSLVDCIRTTWISDRSSNRRVPRKELFSVEGKVINDELYLRTQQWLYIDTRTDLRSCIEAYSHFRWTPRLDTCGHREPYKPIRRWTFRENRSSLLQTRSNRDVPDIMERMITCKECGVSNHSLFVPTAKKGKACVMTRWIRLGTGLYLCPKDELWLTTGKRKSILDARLANHLPFFDDWTDLPEGYVAYEAAGGVSWFQLTKDNQTLLERHSSNNRQPRSSMRNLIPSAATWLRTKVQSCLGNQPSDEAGPKSRSTGDEQSR